MSQHSQFPVFDIQTIRDENWRRHYSRLLSRYRQQARFIEGDYGVGDHRLHIDFVEIDHANASVENDGKGYAVGIASTFPLLLKALFSRLLAQPEICPWMPQQDAFSRQSEKIYFSINANRIGEQVIADQTLTVERDRAALLLSDIAMEFVFLHEVAHILCGHADVKPTLTPGAPGIPELGLTRRAGSRLFSISRAWEYEADIIGANLLKTYLDAIIRQVRSGGADPFLRPLFFSQENLVEQCLSLAMTALYVLFRFLRETSSKLNLGGHHPDPLVRAFAVRNALYQVMSQRHPINKNLLEELLADRLEEFIDGLTQNGMQTGGSLMDETPENLSEALRDLSATRDLHAPLLKGHRYFNWD
jgi:hypothetical protein